jgi:UDP-N-acetylmuramoyl-tripeptide--D-alanyl-D-alanine ligase
MMLQPAMFSLAEAAEAIGARLIGTDRSVFEVVSDSRSVRSGSLFVALEGGRFDGHSFVPGAISSGAAAALISSITCANDAPDGAFLLVDDTAEALGSLATWWRGRHSIPLVAIAGSNGKTTTKEMLSAVLGVEYGADAVLATTGNLNNHIGVPMTLLRLRAHHRAAVIEIGMNHPGETETLARMAAPTVGLINNAQREHQLYMISVENVAKEHGALLDFIEQNGAVVLNAEDRYFEYWRSLAGRRKVLSFALDRPADVSGVAQSGTAGSCIAITILGEPPFDVSLGVPGRHNALNGLAVAAAASALGISSDAIRCGISGFSAVRGRLQKHETTAGGILLDDSYNANPDSVLAAIDVLAQAGGTRVLILGDMDEAGSEARECHREVGLYAKERGIHHLLAKGELSQRTVEAFGQGGEHLQGTPQLILKAKAMDSSDVTFLVKGSRFMKMEEVSEALAR